MPASGVFTWLFPLSKFRSHRREICLLVVFDVMACGEVYGTSNTRPPGRRSFSAVLDYIVPRTCIGASSWIASILRPCESSTRADAHFEEREVTHGSVLFCSR